LRRDEVDRHGPGLTDREIAGRFNVTLGRRWGVRLVGGGAEPLYLPGQPDGGRRAVIRYTRDYAASALHELAHWAIAGRRRRRLVDYGYWYEPPPRDGRAQEAFAAVEAPAQALEWLMADACGLDFRVSVDDVGGSPEFAEQFAERVVAQRRRLDRSVLPPRAAQLIELFAHARCAKITMEPPA
jgi:elongation factor P hydroxylase